jgi:hypothetical protein
VSTTLPVQDNDTRGWVLVHDQIRAVLAAAPEHVRALRAEDPIGARALVGWWLSFSRSFTHHMHAEDDRIWPTLAVASPEIAAELERLTAEHRDIERELLEVDSGVAAMPTLLPTERFCAAQELLLDRFAVLRQLVGQHLDHEERTAVVGGRHRVRPEEWRRLEKDMIKGLSLKDMSSLMPRILEQADESGRAMMLGRLPAPVRLLDQKFFEPRYRRLQRRLPGGGSATER